MIGRPVSVAAAILEPDGGGTRTRAMVGSEASVDRERPPPPGWMDAGWTARQRQTGGEVCRGEEYLIGQGRSEKLFGKAGQPATGGTAVGVVLFLPRLGWATRVGSETVAGDRGREGGRPLSIGKRTGTNRGPEPSRNLWLAPGRGGVAGSGARHRPGGCVLQGGACARQQRLQPPAFTVKRRPAPCSAGA